MTVQHDLTAKIKISKVKKSRDKSMDGDFFHLYQVIDTENQLKWIDHVVDPTKSLTLAMYVGSAC